ncbi:MAG: cytochrome c oxidase subunit 3 family protein [Phycisphaerales bacterium]
MTATEAHAHEHHDFLAHHWDTPEQQFEAGKLGMWLFLATEVLLFGGLFVGYSVWRGNHPELFKFGSQYLDTTMGAINTVVLILSSLTMAWAVTCAQRGNRKGLIIGLLLTLAGAGGFLGIKYVEYSHKFHEGWFPGAYFYNEPPEQSHTWDENLPVPGAVAADIPVPDTEARTIEQLGFPEDIPVETSTVAPPAEGPSGLVENALDVDRHEDEHVEHQIHALQSEDRPANAHMFFNIYFMMTGLHGLHVLVGVGVMIWLLIGAVKGRFNEKYFTPVDLGGLYWHIVDLIWIFLFPLFYLI